MITVLTVSALLASFPTVDDTAGRALVALHGRKKEKKERKRKKERKNERIT